MCAEIDYRINRLQAEAASERLAGPRDGLRQHLGHALMALGRAIHGIEAEHAVRPALDLCQEGGQAWTAGEPTS
jgi:hypothetical protein